MHIIDLNSPIVSDIMDGYRVELTLPHVSGAMLRSEDRKLVMRLT